MGFKTMERVGANRSMLRHCDANKPHVIQCVSERRVTLYPNFIYDTLKTKLPV